MADHLCDVKQALLGLLHLESLDPLPRHPLRFQTHWLLKPCPSTEGSSSQGLMRLRTSFVVLSLCCGEDALSTMMI